MPKTLQIEASSTVKKEVTVKVKKERCDGQEVNTGSSEKKNVETDDLWQGVKTEIKEETEQDSGPSSFVIDIPEDQINVKQESEEGQANLGVQCLSKHSEETAKESGQAQSSNAVEGQLTELEPQVVKRRRLTRKTMQIEASSPVKKEVTVKVKKERCDGQEVSIKSAKKNNVKMDDLWQRMKTEIKEETEQESGPSSFVIDIPEDQINVKQESEEGQANLGVQCLSKHSEETAKESGQAQSSNAVEGQLTELEPQVVKRRRLTRKTMQIEASSPVKKEVTVKVKKERCDGQEVNTGSSEKKNVEMNDLYQRLRKEIHKQSTVQSAASSARPATASQQMQLEQRPCDMAEGAQDPADAGESSLDAFAREAATWAKLCLAFRSSQTWSPTRPCCPANFFLGVASGTPSAPAEDAPACVLRLNARGLRCLHRFQERHRQTTATEKNEADTDPVAAGRPPADCVLMQDQTVRGRDCMKMWPWMRDLPTGVWAGNGWAFDENGLRRLSSPGGSQAMQGAEVFESVGAAAEEMKRSDEHMKEVGVPAAVDEGAAPPLEGPKPSTFLRNNVAKQSGVPNVIWSSDIAWKVPFPTFDAAGKKTGTTCRKFSVQKFMGPGMDEAQADAAALQAAKNFRAELVKQGVLSEPKPKDPNFTSEVPGVYWVKSVERWEVRIVLKGTRKGGRGGWFTDKAAAEAKALELRQQHGLERQVKAVSSLAELPVFQPKVPYPGVKWSQAEQQWHAQCHVGGVRRNFRMKPKDHSEEEVQRSFQVAVAWRKKQEKERETAVKAKAKPGKKQRK